MVISLAFFCLSMKMEIQRAMPKKWMSDYEMSKEGNHNSFKSMDFHGREYGVA